MRHDRGDCVEGVGRKILGPADEVSRDIVDEARQRSVREDFRHRLVDRGGVSEVDGHGGDLPASRFAQPGCGFFQDVAATAPDHHFLAMGGIALGHRLSESGAATSHQDLVAPEQVRTQHRHGLPPSFLADGQGGERKSGKLAKRR
jgi:hypothetical protein